MTDLDLDELRSELDEFAQPEKKGGRSTREERIIAGFEEIQRFVEKQSRAPQHGEDHDIFERLYAVRLDRLRGLEEARSLLTPLDRQGLLTGPEIAAAAPAESMDDDELLAELGGAAGTVVDVLAFSLAAFFASHRSLVARRAIALIGPPVAVVVLAVGVATLRAAPVRDAIGESAPAFAPVVEFLSSG